MINDQVGKVIKSYELEGLVGIGGFGAVYRARQAIVDREVAIKIIWPAFANHPDFIRRFDAEAQLVATLEHPYIVPLYDYWRDADGAYLVMRYLRGGHLRETMSKSWSLNDAYRFLSQVGSALALAHRHGVVHRDIKPENILLDEEHNVYLADFGIAQLVSNHTSDDLLSSLGSHAYASPEQISHNETTSQSDIYSLAIVLYELLAGEYPFPQLAQLSMTQLMEFRTNAGLPSLLLKRPDLPSAIDDVLSHATAIDPYERYPDALTFIQAFQEAMDRTQLRSLQLPETDDLIPNPYKGLRAFQEADAANFFGREALIQRLVKRLKDDTPYKRFLTVVGPSGCGKSSLIKAGLIPALRQGALLGSENWFYDEFVPSAQPFATLANALIGMSVDPPPKLAQHLYEDERCLLETVNQILPDDDTELFLFIDQFEELFTLVEDEDVIARFLHSLYTAITEPTSRLYVVMTIRADFYDRPLLQPSLSDLVRERTEVVVPLSRTELERTIVEPARRSGVVFDSGLVATIIAEVKEQPAALPLLQYTLSELFERREGGTVTPSVYREIGGVRGSLARRADELYGDFDAEQREAMRQLFLRLTTLGEGTEDTRRRVLLAEVTSLCEEASTAATQVMQEVIDTVGQARLLTFDRDPTTRSPTVEVTHEAIIREWERLRGWLDDSRNDVRLQRTLSSLAAAWAASQQEPSFLLRGVRLDTYEKWVTKTSLALTEQEKHYLHMSIAERVQRERRERERQEREAELERRSINRLRLLVGVLLLAVVGALGLTGFALNESARANRSAAVSQSIALEAGARQTLIDAEGDLAILLALEANQLDNPPLQSRSTLSEVAFAPGTRAVFAGDHYNTRPQADSGHTAWVQAVAISPDNRYVASGSTDATVKLWDTETGAVLHTMTAHGGDVFDVAFSPDGSLLASVASDFLLIVWDVATGTEVRRFIGHTGNVRSVAFSPDGRNLLTASSDSTLILWDVATGDLVRQIEADNEISIEVVAYNPDGLTAVSGARDGTLTQWDLTTGAELQAFGASGNGHQTGITAVAFSRDGHFLVSSSADGVILVWDVASGTIAQRMFGSTVEVDAVAFNPDNTLVYSGSIDNQVHVWSVETGLEVNRLGGHSDDVLALALSQDGRLLVSGAKDRDLRLWNVGQVGAEREWTDHRRRVPDLALSNDGAGLFSVSADGSLQMRPLAREEQPAQRLLEDMLPLQALALSPDGTRLLVGTRAGLIYQVNSATGEIIGEFVGHNESVESLVFLSDGQRALSTSLDERIILWDLTSGTAIRDYVGHERSVFGLALLPDESGFVSSGADERIILWDLETGAILREFLGHEGTVYAIDVYDNLMASGARDEKVILWDLETGEQLTTLVGDTGTIWHVAFSPDGQRLASGANDGQLLIWDVAEQALLQRFTAPSNAIFGLAFAPDGRYIFTGMEDGSIFSWRAFDTQALIEWTQQNRYVREFSCVERLQFRVPPLCE